MAFIGSSTSAGIVKIGHKDIRTSIKDVSEINRKTIGDISIVGFEQIGLK